MVIWQCIWLEILVLGGGDVKLVDVGEFGIQCVDNELCFIFVEFEGFGIGENDVFLVKVQVYWVGVQLVIFQGVFVIIFVEQVQGVIGVVFQIELFGQGCFERYLWLLVECGVGEQLCQFGGFQFVEG